MSAGEREILARIERLEQENALLRQATSSERLRLRALSNIAVMAIVLSVVVVGGTPALAQDKVNPSGKPVPLQDQVNQLRADLNAEIGNRASSDATLQNNINAEASTRAAADTSINFDLANESSAREQIDFNLQQAIDAVAEKTQFISIESGDMFFTGTNVHVRSSASDLGPYGKGNLVVGIKHTNLDKGTNCLVVGEECNLSHGENGAYGGVVFGFQNNLSGRFCQITGGYNNSMVENPTVCTTSGGTGLNNGGFGVWKAGDPTATPVHGRFISP